MIVPLTFATYILTIQSHRVSCFILVYWSGAESCQATAGKYIFRTVRKCYVSFEHIYSKFILKIQKFS